MRDLTMLRPGTALFSLFLFSKPRGELVVNVEDQDNSRHMMKELQTRKLFRC